jgi:hypothetical protein
MARLSMNNLDDVKENVETLARQISAPINLLPSYGIAEIDRPSYVEHHGSVYHYVTSDNGHDIERKIAFNLDELLFFVFKDITFEMAIAYSKEHRTEGADFRRSLFDHQLYLLERLNVKWKEKQIKEIESVLKQYPFVDR